MKKKFMAAITAAAVAAAAFAPVVLVGGAAGVTAGVLAKVAVIGGIAGVILDAVYQGIQINSGERNSFNGYEAAICFLTGAAGAITGPKGASLMAMVNYVGVEIVNDNTPSGIGVTVNGILGYLSGVFASHVSRGVQAGLEYSKSALNPAVNYFGKPFASKNAIANYERNYLKVLLSGLAKALTITNPWFVETSIDTIAFPFDSIGNYIQNRWSEFCGASD